MFSLYRAGFYLCHIQVIVSKMGQQVVKGTAGMVYFKANADLFGIFQKDLLVRHNNEPGRIVIIIIDFAVQYFQPVISAACSLQIAAWVTSFSFRIFFAATAVLATPICCHPLCSSRYFALCINACG